MLMLVFWVTTPCGLTGRYHRFIGILPPFLWLPGHTKRRGETWNLAVVLICVFDVASYTYRKSLSDGCHYVASMAPDVSFIDSIASALALVSSTQQL
jgi:hypothetical protein